MNLKRYIPDVWIVLSVTLLSILGIMFAYSSNIQITDTKEVNDNSYIRQMFFFATGLMLMTGVVLINYKKLAEHSLLLFFICVGLLLYTKGFGKVVNGSRRWINLGVMSFQPSEFVKILMVIVIADFLDRHRGHLHEWRALLRLAGLVLIPALLIFLQPDLGTALVFLPMTLAMLYVGGMPMKLFSGLLLVGFLSTSIPLSITYSHMVHLTDNPLVDIVSNKFYLLLMAFFFLMAAGGLFLINLSMRNLTISSLIFFCTMIFVGLILALSVESFLLKEYQRERLLAFLNPHLNKWDFGYNVIQSQITVGSGGFWGKGFAQGTQGQLGFLPSRSTDFIFSVIGEELGFLGSGLIVGVFIFFIFRLIKVAREAKDNLGGLIAVGILTKFSIQIFINIGMNIGMAPVTGIPLPFLTYGGSALWTSLLAVGLVLNVAGRKYVHH